MSYSGSYIFTYRYRRSLGLEETKIWIYEYVAHFYKSEIPVGASYIFFHAGNIE